MSLNLRERVREQTMIKTLTNQEKTLKTMLYCKKNSRLRDNTLNS